MERHHHSYRPMGWVKLLALLLPLLADRAVTSVVAGIAPDDCSQPAMLGARDKVDARPGALTVDFSPGSLRSGSDSTRMSSSRGGGSQPARLKASLAAVVFPAPDLQLPEEMATSEGRIASPSSAASRWHEIATISFLVLILLPALAMLIAQRWLGRRIRGAQPENSPGLKPHIGRALQKPS